MINSKLHHSLLSTAAVLQQAMTFQTPGMLQLVLALLSLRKIFHVVPPSDYESDNITILLKFSMETPITVKINPIFFIMTFQVLTQAYLFNVIFYHSAEKSHHLY